MPNGCTGKLDRPFYIVELSQSEFGRQSYGRNLSKVNISQCQNIFLKIKWIATVSRPSLPYGVIVCLKCRPMIQTTIN